MLESQLTVLHFNHALRGDESDGDASFTEELANSLRIRYLGTKADWHERKRPVSEADARDARLRFFQAACAASPEVPAYIVTGHHGDDVAETFLMRLSRGAGIEGLCAPRSVSEAGGGLVFLRPLLGWDRVQIREELAAAEIPWREDSSNFASGNYRARLRNQVIPSWAEAADRPLAPGVNRSRQLLEEDALTLESLTDEKWRAAWDEDRGRLARAAVVALPVALRRRLLVRLPSCSSLSASALETALACLESEDTCTVEVSAGRYLEVGEQWIRSFERSMVPSTEWRGFNLPEGTIAYLPDGARVGAIRMAVGTGFAAGLRVLGNDEATVAYLRLGGNSPASLHVRRKQTGDAFKPHGKTSAKKLKDLFIERKVEQGERDRLPVFLADGSEILWVPGLPPNLDRALSDSCETALRLTYDR